jgi:hypothetical protein
MLRYRVVASPLKYRPAMSQLSPLPMIKLGKYRHYKGMLYEVLDVARHSETLAPMVIYRALYGDFGLWVRPADMFTESVTIDGETLLRFKFVEDC